MTAILITTEECTEEIEVYSVIRVQDGEAITSPKHFSTYSRARQHAESLAARTREQIHDRVRTQLMAFSF